MYGGRDSHTPSLGDKKNEKEKKNEVREKTGKEKKKGIRRVQDGLLLVVPTKIYGKSVRALIDSGATRCFITPSCVNYVGLKGIPRDVFLELGTGEKYLSRGYVPEVPISTAGLTVKVGLTITNLLYEVDLMLGINWLQLVNPVVDWCGAELYVPNAVHTALLQGNWLAYHVQAGTVTVLSSEEELKKMNDERIQKKIAILKCPRFWREQTNAVNLRTNSLKGHVNYDVEWGYLYENDCQICKKRMNV